MKPLFNTLTVIALLLTTVANAKIWRVNNTTGIAANFTTAQAAHDGAAAGDTLHFEPSITSYGDLTMSKRLVLIGIGVSAFNNKNTPNQVSSFEAQIGFLTINSGAANSIIMVTSNGITINSASNITIQRCYVATNPITVNNGDNLLVRHCFIDVNLIIGSVTTNGSTGVIINNNILTGISVDVNSSANIINNVITTVLSSINNSTIRNNIFTHSFNDLVASSSTIQNNIFRSGISTSSINTGNNTISGNQGNINLSTVLANNGAYNATTADAGYQLKSGSPAIGAGTGGEDCGAFGGADPYKIAVQPPVPAIYKLLGQSSVGNTLTITISTKSNN